MSHKKQICVVVLGREDVLKLALISQILGRDLSPKTRVLKNTEIYENSRIIVIRTPDLNEWKDDTREVFAINRNPDMSLLVVKEGFSTGEVWMQIDSLSKLTGKPTEEFIVVLPLSYTDTESLPFRFCTIAQLFSELRTMAEERDLKPTSRSPAGYLDPGMSTSYKLYPAMDETDMPTPNKQYAAMDETAGSHLSATRVNLVLLGMAGSGKSASGNTIIGQKIFLSRPSSDVITKECHEHDTEIEGRRVRVIDTPDIFDDDINSSTEHVRKCKELCQGGPSVYLLVMHVSRFTDGERVILRKLKKAFGPRVHDQTIILFTRENDLKQGDMTEDAFKRSFTPDLNAIVTKCGNRFVFFENKTSRSDQVEKLMQTVDQIIK